MTPAEILRQAAAAGVTLAAQDGQILARPAGLVTPELRRAIAAQKDALLESLTGLTHDVPVSGTVTKFQSLVESAMTILDGEILDVDLAQHPRLPAFVGIRLLDVLQTNHGLCL